MSFPSLKDQQPPLVNPETEKQIDIISVAVVPSKKKKKIQPKLKNNNMRLIKYTCSTRL